ncbi:S41 family peptidase [Aquimarina agarivorans]|uniref:S41 family peptidase n=1 Tax=Aquimarina agarivorans TaxID=980584 RepID=UPI000248F627|nr:S41 family peptidase [Aquimarina agarivorans]
MSLTRSVLLLMIGFSLGFALAKRFFNTPGSFSFNPSKEKLNRLIDYIDNVYVDPVDTDSIVEVTVKGILGKLDPHSTYISAKDAASVNERMQGDFIGIGVNYYVWKDTIAVISTIPSGPSAKAGILSGDRILMANKDTLFGARLDRDTLVSKLKGPVNSKVDLLVYRPQKGNLNVKVTRGVVPLQSVEAAFMLTPEVGCVKVERFSETTYTEFKAAFDALAASNTLKSLVLDLRGNGGGYVRPALKMADEFLEDDKLIMFTKNRQGDIDKSFATKKGDFEEGQVYVLIDENSASASEILAGALQDNDKGTIVGRRSFGKGLVQREMDLGDGSVVRLTVSQYFTPTGRSIQRSYKNGIDAYNEEYLKRYDTGELQDSTKIKVNDSLVFTTPRGKVVYGGGGIIPDVYVGRSKDRNLEVLEFAEYSGVMSRFVFEELDTNRSFYNTLNKENMLSLEITDVLLRQFKNYAAQRGLEFSGTSANEQAKVCIKAEVANQLFSTNLSYRLKAKIDPMLQRILTLEQKAEY